MLDEMERKRDGARSSSRTLMRLTSYFLDRKSAPLLVIVALVIASSFLGTYPILLIKRVVDIAARREPGGPSLLVAACLLYLLMHLLCVAASRAAEAISKWLEGQIGHEMRVSAFNKAQMLSLSFYESKKTGEILSRLVGDAEATVQGLLEPITNMIRTGTTFAFAVFFMISMDWRMTLLCLPAGIISALLVAITGRMLRRRQRQARESADKLWSRLIESLQGMKEIQANNQQMNMSSQVSEMSEEVRASSLSLGKAEVVLSGCNDAVFMGAIGLILLAGGYRTWQGAMTFGELTAFMMYTHMLVDPIASLMMLSRKVQKIIVSAERIFDILDEVPKISELDDAQSLTVSKGEIRLNSVSFDYKAEGGERDILKDVSVTISPGKKLVLIGPSGGGKTTLVKLIARFYDPVKGNIEIDGVDIRNVSLKSLRSQMGILFQQPFIFNGSLRENIAIGKPEGATPSEIEAAASAAGLDRLLLTLPLGLDTQVGERGTKLSVGEQQRLGLARVLLKRPPIIILDEPASSLDAITTAEIMGRLRGVLEDRTIVIIAHQLTTVADADQIVVLENGRIVETGVHEALYRAGGTYSQMYDAQFAVR